MTPSPLLFSDRSDHIELLRTEKRSDTDCLLYKVVLAQLESEGREIPLLFIDMLYMAVLPLESMNDSVATVIVPFK